MTELRLPDSEEQFAQWRLLSMYLAPCWCGSTQPYARCHRDEDRLMAAEQRRGRDKVDWTKHGF